MVSKRTRVRFDSSGAFCCSWRKELKPLMAAVAMGDMLPERSRMKASSVFISFLFSFRIGILVWCYFGRRMWRVNGGLLSGESQAIWPKMGAFCWSRREMIWLFLRGM